MPAYTVDFDKHTVRVFATSEAAISGRVPGESLVFGPADPLSGDSVPSDRLAAFNAAVTRVDIPDGADAEAMSELIFEGIEGLFGATPMPDRSANPDAATFSTVGSNPFEMPSHTLGGDVGPVTPVYVAEPVSEQDQIPMQEDGEETPDAVPGETDQAEPAPVQEPDPERATDGLDRPDVAPQDRAVAKGRRPGETRGRHSPNEGKALYAVFVDGSNPFRPGSRVHASTQLVVDNPGITFESFVERGGNPSDLSRAIRMGLVRAEAAPAPATDPT